MTLSRAIVQQWMALDSQELHEPALQAARLHLLDAVGVGLAAASLEQGAPYSAFLTGSSGPVNALTGARSHDPAEVALVNGGLIHAIEYDDTHTASIIHGSAVLAPAALAAAQARGATPQAAIRAYMLGYEALIRMGLAAPGAFQARGFQVTSVAGALAAALVAADLFGASEDQRVHAMGIALSQSSGVFEFLSNGSTVKSLHPGWAAHAGIIAARLAMAGMTGPQTALEGARGLFASFAGEASASDRLADLMEDFGARWRIEDVAFKFLPCCHYLHPFVEAAGELADQGVTPQRISALVLRIAPGAAPIVCEPWAAKLAPPDGHAARWSLPVTVAARLVEGRVDHQTFRQAPGEAVLALAARCRHEALEPNHFPHAFEAEIEAHLIDGAIATAGITDVYGNARRPAARIDVLAKFRANAGRLLDEAAAAALEAFFLAPNAHDFAPFAAALGAIQPEA